MSDNDASYTRYLATLSDDELDEQLAAYDAQYQEFVVARQHELARLAADSEDK